MAGLTVLIKKSAGAQSAGNLTRRGLKRPEFLIVDGSAELDSAIAAVWG